GRAAGATGGASGGPSYLPPKPVSIEVRSGANGALIATLRVGQHALGDAAAVVGDCDGGGGGGVDVAVRGERKANRDHVDLFPAKGGAALRSFEGEDEEGFGETLAAAGDVNGDG